MIIKICMCLPSTLLDPRVNPEVNQGYPCLPPGSTLGSLYIGRLPKPYSAKMGRERGKKHLRTFYCLNFSHTILKADLIMVCEFRFVPYGHIKSDGPPKSEVSNFHTAKYQDLSILRLWLQHFFYL